MIGGYKHKSRAVGRGPPPRQFRVPAAGRRSGALRAAARTRRRSASGHGLNGGRRRRLVRRSLKDLGAYGTRKAVRADEQGPVPPLVAPFAGASGPLERSFGVRTPAKRRARRRLRASYRTRGAPDVPDRDRGPRPGPPRHPQPAREAQRLPRRACHRPRRGDEEAADDHDVRVIVLRGNGPVFSAGVDVGGLAGTGADVRNLRGFRRESIDACNLMEETAKPVIASIQARASAARSRRRSPASLRVMPPTPSSASRRRASAWSPTSAGSADFRVVGVGARRGA